MGLCYKHIGHLSILIGDFLSQQRHMSDTRARFLGTLYPARTSSEIPVRQASLADVSSCPGSLLMGSLIMDSTWA